MRRVAILVFACILAGAASVPHASSSPEPAVVRVRLVTGAGPVVLALDTRHAPATTANFLRYVDDGRFDGTVFYRASRRKSAPTTGFVQGGVDTDARRMLDPVAFEPTSRTGLHHVDSAISMARYDRTDSATGNFSIMVGANPAMDANSGSPGYAVFGHVVAGMDVVRRILAGSTAPGGNGAFKGQLLVRPVTIVRAIRLDGIAKPTGGLKVWVLLQGMPH